MERNIINIVDIVGDFDNCPHCGISFLGKDIYQYFLEEYTNNWPYKYALTKERILESKTNFSDLYANFPDNLDDMTDIEANALYTASSYGWHTNNKKCFRNGVISVETEQYDGITWFFCQRCERYWKRFEWSDEKYLHT
jgi:hypothetical protein